MFTEKRHLLEDFYETESELGELKETFKTKLEKINECKEPELVTREKLINKYLT